LEGDNTKVAKSWKVRTQCNLGLGKTVQKQLQKPIKIIFN
jgi:hypothetical protein